MTVYTFYFSHENNELIFDDQNMILPDRLHVSLVVLYFADDITIYHTIIFICVVGPNDCDVSTRCHYEPWYLLCSTWVFIFYWREFQLLKGDKMQILPFISICVSQYFLDLQCLSVHCSISVNIFSWWIISSVRSVAVIYFLPLLLFVI